MARKLKESFDGQNYKVKIHRDTEWNEYRVTLFKWDFGLPDQIISVYHTDDLADARATGQTILIEAESA